MNGVLSKSKRSLKLIAEFNNGYAEGWFFAVPKFFEDQLDIKKTERKCDNKIEMVWTQGKLYSFDTGHILYDSPHGYTLWSEALKKIKYVCSIINGKPCTTDEEGKMSDGQVHFSLSKPDPSKTGLETIGDYHASQVEFIGFLKTGKPYIK